MKEHPLSRAVLLLVLGVLLFTPLTLAQEGESGDDGEQKSVQKKAQISDEIVVTARKREENVQEVPVAVSVVTAETLEDSAASDISELQAYVPNLSIYPGRNQSTTLTAFMRGIGQADPLWGVDPGVGLYIDDVYIARPQGALLDVYDVGRIEVLRGPQGTLYGKNTIGGAIKYVSREMTDDTTGSLSYTGGSFSNQDFRFNLSGAVVPGKFRAKVAYASLQHDGYGKNLFTGREVSNKDTQAFRVGFDFLPSENVLIQLSYDRTEDDAEPKGLTRLAGNPLCFLFLGGPCNPEAEVHDTRSGLAPLNSTTASGSSLRITWDINDTWQFKSITALRESDTENNIDFDTTPAPITDVEATYYDEQTSQEFQFIYTGGGKLDGVFGFYYFDGEAGGLVRNNFLNLLFGTTEGTTFTESMAVFGEASYAVNDKLTFNFGLRVTEEDKRGVAFNAGYTDATFSQINAVTADYDKTKTFSSVAPKLGLDYQLSDNAMFYVSLSRGFKSGGFNVRAQSTFFPQSAEPFDDEVFSVVELGLKSFVGDSLTLNTAAFYGNYDDIQVSTFTSFDSNGDGEDDAFFGNFLNAGNATMKGLEVEFDWSSGSFFGVSGNVSYLDAEPDEFLDANNDGFVDTQVITNAPEFTGALRLNFNFPAFGGLLSASTGVAFRDDSVLTNEGGPHPADPTRPLLPLVQPSFELWDAWISWLPENGKWRVGIVGKNLGDEEYLTNGYNIPVLGLLQGSFGTPRTVTATIEYRFF